MRIARIFTNSEGDSVFSDFTIAIENAGDIGQLSQRYSIREIIFRKTGANYDYDFHNAPQRQFVIFLDGETEVETSLGDKRIFKAGDILLAEDIDGKGHKSKSIDKKIRRSIFVTIGDKDAEIS